MIVPFPSRDSTWAPIGERICALREARGLSLDELALKVRLSRADLARAEAGRGTLSTGQLYAVASALHVPMRMLFEPSFDITSVREFRRG